MMSDPVANGGVPAPAIPSFADQLIRAIAQKGLTAAATALTGWGVIQSSQQAMFVSLGISAILWFASFAWTYVREHSAHKEFIAAVNSPAADPPVPVK